MAALIFTAFASPIPLNSISRSKETRCNLCKSFATLFKTRLVKSTALSFKLPLPINSASSSALLKKEAH